ncbi:MAG: tRNA lysidine(34) synthetase TilS, partial [Eubacteriales bacterium]|nr:tRNA lysidine(34) synthetase TilS [Eubacteriales bacterium]
MNAKRMKTFVSQRFPVAEPNRKCYNIGMDEQILTAVETALNRAGLLRRGAVLLVALSGGADSVLLLRTVCALSEKHGFTVRAAHVEHGLRGESSLRDAEFCERLCKTLGVPFTCDHASLAGSMADAGAEARARDARYALLLARAKGADALLLAHHQDDQAETVLAHLLRGSGARGLGGMRPVSRRDGVTVVRPLLDISKHAILTALGGLPYCEDESNALPCCQRNRLRTEAMPLLTRENPRAAAHMAQSAALLRMDDDYLQSLADARLNEALLDTPPFFCVRKAPLLSAPEAVAVRALRTAAERAMAL